MSTPITAFADLIAPIRPETFFSDSWEIRPLHIRRSDSRYYDALLTNGDVEAAISSGGLRYPAIQLAKGGAFYPPEVFTRNIRSGNDVFGGVPDLDRISAEYKAGATITLPAFHRAWRPLGTLASAVEDYFDHAVHTNVYITPGNTNGFSPHYDTHEVFVLQIAGNKHWKVYEPPLALPHRSEPFRSHGYELPPVLLEVDLAAGDILYLPRGFVHTTLTVDSFSVHVTLGITVYTWMDLVGELIQSRMDDLRLRRALPPGFASREYLKSNLEREFSEIIAELQKAANCQKLVNSFSYRVRLGRPGRSGIGGEFRSNVTATGLRAPPKIL